MYTKKQRIGKRMSFMDSYERALLFATSEFDRVNQIGEFSVNGDRCETIPEISVNHESSGFKDELMCVVKLGGSEIEVVVTMPCRRVRDNVVDVNKNVELKAFIPGMPTDSGRVQSVEIYVAEEIAMGTVRKALGLPIPSVPGGLARYQGKAK
jgi:hypothetical protein